MKRFAFYLSVSLLTHLIGLTAVSVTGFLPNLITLPEDSPVITEDFEAEDVVTIETAQSSTHELSLKYHPGGGSGPDGPLLYRTSDGQEVIARISCCKTSKEVFQTLNERISKAAQIVERVRNYQNRDGKFGERIVIINRPDKDGKETVSVLWYGEDKIIILIDASTLEAALEFERSDAYAYSKKQGVNSRRSNKSLERRRK